MTTFRNLRALAQLDTIRVTMERADLIDLLSAYDLMASKTPAKARKAAKATEASVLPDWLPLEAWEAFLAMRKQIKKPATEYAQKLLIKKLAAFHANDMDVGTILNQSIVSGWQDLYAPRENHTDRRAPQMTVQEQNRRNAEEARRLLGFQDLEGSIL